MNDLRQQSNQIEEMVAVGREFVSRMAEKAYVSMGLAANPYKSQIDVLNSHNMILALFGGNQCLHPGSEITMADGTKRYALDVVRGDWIMGFDFSTGSFRPTKVLEVFFNGLKETHLYQHRHGIVSSTRAHRFCVVHGNGNFGWNRAARFLYNNRMAVSRNVNSGGWEPTDIVWRGPAGFVETIDFHVDNADNAFVADNLVVHNSGKSHAGAHKMAWDLTGVYPDWYRGKRTIRGIDAWALGDTNENTRDNCQKKLFGANPDRPGWTDRPGETALIASRYIIGKPTRRSGVQGAFDTVRVKHIPSDTISTVTFKSHSFDLQALASWTGDFVWLDEEPPRREVIDELLMRIIRRKGQLMITFTPLLGMTEVVKFLLTAPEDIVARDFLGWDQARHLGEDEKNKVRMLYASQPGVLKARMEGRPTANSGLIFPFNRKDIWFDRSKIVMRDHWPTLGGMDVGWRHPTGAIAMAKDPRTGIKYLYASYRKAETHYKEHHDSLLQWGNLKFMIDPSSTQVDKATGNKILEEYWKLAHGRHWADIDEIDRKYVRANNSFAPGMNSMFLDFVSGRLKVASDLDDWWDEYEGYAWNNEGTGPVKKRDDLMDPTRYANISFDEFARSLDMTPTWESVVDAEETLASVDQWKPYRAGRN